MIQAMVVVPLACTGAISVLRFQDSTMVLGEEMKKNKVGGVMIEQVGRF